jgi:beta-lactamase class A
LPAFIALMTFAIALVLVPQTAAAKSRYPDLFGCHDEELQKAVEALFPEDDEVWQLIRDKKISGILVDVSDLENPRCAEFNPDLMLYAASLPKIAIALGAFVEIDRGELELDDELRAQLIGMIKRSSNRDASAVLRKVGIERLAEILIDERYGKLYDEQAGGGLWVGKPYDKSAAWRRDPLKGVSHAASARQAARFYYGILTGTLIDPKHLPLLEEMFGSPSINHKFVKGLKGRSDVEIYRKSGTWRNYHADSGVIVHPDIGLTYILVAIDDDSEAGRSMIDDVRKIDDLLIERHLKRNPGQIQVSEP